MRHALLLALLLPAAASADDLSDMIRAREVSQVVATAYTCGFAIDPGEVETFIANELVKMPEVSRLSYQTIGLATASELEKATPAQKTATCALMKALGEKHGIVK